MDKTTLTAIEETWGDSRITVYKTDDNRLFIEFCYVSKKDDTTRGIFIQLNQKDKKYDDYTAATVRGDERFTLPYSQVKLKLNNRPRVACDWFTLHSINSLRIRTRNERVENYRKIQEAAL